MKVLIVDPALHSMGGHHYNAARRLQSELAALGIVTRCLGSAQADDTTMRELACVPCFSRSIYGRTYSGRREFADAVADAARELSQALREYGAWPDLVVLPCCDQVLAAALAQVLRRHPLRPAPVLLAWLLYTPHRHLATGDPAAAAQNDECRRAFTTLDAAIDDAAIAAYCETDAMADLYRGLLPFDVGVVAGPGPVIPPGTRKASRDDRMSVVVCAGFANKAKGYRLLPDALARVLRYRRDVRFMIHGIVDGSDDAEGHSTFDRLARLGDRVVVNREILDESQYLDWLAQADLVLLPYEPAAYRLRGSGLFTEARRIGIPVVVPRGADFARAALDEGWGIGIAEHGAAAVAAAVIEALDRLHGLHARLVGPDDRLAGILREQADAARARQPPGLSRRFRRLLRAVAPGAAI